MQKLEVYKCGDAVVEVIGAGDGQLVCCDNPMELLEEKTADAATEKHVPVIEKQDGGVKVTVGSVPHPMVEDHWIQWIEIQYGNTVSRQTLNPGDAPEAFFPGVTADDIVAREYCNKHGLWKA